MIFPAVLLLAAPLVLATPLDLASEDLQPANKSSWACPEVGLDFYGHDITHFANIPSWQHCGKGTLQIRIDKNIPSRHLFLRLLFPYTSPIPRLPLPSAPDLQPLDMVSSQVQLVSQDVLPEELGWRR